MRRELALKKENRLDDIGIVASGSQPNKMKFYSLNPITEDYVMVSLGKRNERVIYEVTSVDAYNSRMEDMELFRYILPGEDYTKYNIYRVEAKPLGGIDGNRMCNVDPWFVAPPGENVKEANMNDIALVYGVEYEEGKQKVGKIIRHEHIQVWLDMPKLLTTHMAIVGRSGQGKSNFVKVLLKMLPMKYMLFTKVNEYVAIDNAISSDLEYAFILWNINIIKKTFDLNNSEIQYLKEYINSLGELEKVHSLELSKKIQEYYTWKDEKYQQVNIFGEVQPIMENLLPKYVESLCRKLESISLEIIPEQNEERKESCVINMQKLTDKEEEITLFTYLNRLLCDRRIHYKEVKESIPLEDRIVIFIEEAHNYIPSTRASFCRDVIRQIAREGRKLGIHLVLLSQRPRHLDPTALSQCGSIVSFNLTNPEDIDYLMTNANFYGDYYKNIIRDLKIGECVIVSDYILKGINCKVDLESNV